jgi:DNA-binding transcriptional LysR family regulator
MLEEELNTSLLARSARGVAPTESGMALFRHARRIIQLADNTKEALKDSDLVVSGRVRLGMPSSIAMAIAPTLIGSLKAQFPQIALEIHEAPSILLASNLSNNKIDIGILVDEPIMPGLQYTSLLEERLCFVQSKSKPLIKCGPLMAANSLVGIPFYLPTQATTLRVAIDDLFRRLGSKPVVYAEASSINTLLNLVVEGDAATLLVPSAFTSQWARRAISWALIEPAVIRRVHVATSVMNELSMAATTVKGAIALVTEQLINAKKWSEANSIVKP